MRVKIILTALVVLVTLSVGAAAEKRIDINIEGRPALGPEGAPVTIIEFLDFQ